jgi:hypothetical protein
MDGSVNRRGNGVGLPCRTHGFIDNRTGGVVSSWLVTEREAVTAQRSCHAADPAF